MVRTPSSQPSPHGRGGSPPVWRHLWSFASRRFDDLDIAARVELRGAHLLLDGGERPDVPERIDDGGDAVAPAGVLRLGAQDRAGLDRAGRHGVKVVDAELKNGAAAAGRRWRAGAGKGRVSVALGIGAGDREGGAADRDIDAGDLAGLGIYPVPRAGGTEHRAI